MTTPNMGLPELIQSQAQPHVTINYSLRLLDALAQLAVLDIGDVTPAGTEADGDVTIIGAGASGAFAGFAENTLAVKIDTGWVNVIPEDGWIAWVISAQAYYRYNASSPDSWEPVRTQPDLAAFDFFFTAAPTSSQLLLKRVIGRAMEFASNFSLSTEQARGHVGTNPAATFTMSVKKNGVQIGTIGVSTGGVFAFDTTSGLAQSFAVGDRLEVFAPSSTDASIANLACVLLAHMV